MKIVRLFIERDIDGERSYTNAEILHGLLTSLNIEKAHILGLSLGGRIAIDFALEFPQQVSSLILAAPGLGGYPLSIEELNRRKEIQSIAEKEGALQAVEKVLQDPSMIPAMENPAIREKIRQLAIDNAQIYVRLYTERVPEWSAAERLSEINVPTLIIVGDRDTQYIYAIVDLLETGIVGVQKVEIKGAGHIVNMEKEEEFNQAVLDFLGHLSQ